MFIWYRGINEFYGKLFYIILFIELNLEVVIIRIFLGLKCFFFIFRV